MLTYKISNLYANYILEEEDDSYTIMIQYISKLKKPNKCERVSSFPRITILIS